MNDQSHPETALATYEGLTMVVSPAEAMKRVQELRAFVSANMVPGMNGDYAVLPGTNKPTLLQPGAQKLCEIYGFAVSFSDVEVISDWDRPLFVFRKKCVLSSRRDGRFICDGMGSANSKEDRYAWRWVGERDVPPGVDKATLKARTKRGERGDWTQYRLPNDDIFSLVNTIEKMACKRALIHATLNATRSAGIFTQDKEDLPPEAFGVAEEQRSWEGQEDTSAKFAEFEKRITAADTMPVLSRVAADIKKSKLEASISDRLLKLWLEKRDAIGGKPTPAPKPETKPAEPPQEREPGQEG